MKTEVSCPIKHIILLVLFSSFAFGGCGKLKGVRMENEKRFFEFRETYSNEILKLESVAMRFDDIATNTANFYWEEIELQRFFRTNESVVEAYVFDMDPKVVYLSPFKFEWYAYCVTDCLYSTNRMTLSTGAASVYSRRVPVLIFEEQILSERIPNRIIGLRLMVVEPARTGKPGDGQSEERQSSPPNSEAAP